MITYLRIPLPMNLCVQEGAGGRYRWGGMATTCAAAFGSEEREEDTQMITYLITVYTATYLLAYAYRYLRTYVYRRGGRDTGGEEWLPPRVPQPSGLNVRRRHIDDHLRDTGRVSLGFTLNLRVDP